MGSYMNIKSANIVVRIAEWQKGWNDSIKQFNPIILLYTSRSNYYYIETNLLNNFS